MHFVFCFPMKVVGFPCVAFVLKRVWSTKKVYIYLKKEDMYFRIFVKKNGYDFFLGVKVRLKSKGFIV